MLIRVNQIENAELALFVQQKASGDISGALQPYLINSGWLGNNVVYTTGGDQAITGQKTFRLSPNVPYSGNTGTAPSTLWVLDRLNNDFVNRGNTNDIISGKKTFTGTVGVSSPIETGDAINLKYANDSLVHKSGAELITGIKTFESEIRIHHGFRSAAKFIGTTNYTFGSGDYVVIATGSVANNTGILPSPGLFSGNFLIIKNAKSIGYQISGTIDSETNPTILPNDAVMLYSDNGRWNYIRQTGFIASGGGGGSADTSVLSGYVENNFVHRSGNGPEFVTGIKTFVSELRFNSGIKTPVRLIGDANYNISSGDFLVMATGSVANNTGILPAATDHSGNLFIIKNAKSIGYQISGTIDSETNPTILPNDAFFVYSANGRWNYIRQTGIVTSGGGGTTINNTYNITGTGVVNASSNASGNITNTFNIASGVTNVTNSGVATNTFNVSGTLNNNTNISDITGNFVNISFFFDEFNLITGLNLLEAFVSREFTFTGYGLGLINTGTAGGFLSGALYQRSSTNVKTKFVDFFINSGQFFKAAGGLNTTITGMNRVGVEIYQTITGMTGFSVGVFGVGY